MKGFQLKDAKLGIEIWIKIKESIFDRNIGGKNRKINLILMLGYKKL